MRILIEAIVAIVIIAVILDAELRTQSIDLMHELFEFIKQSAIITYNHSKDFFQYAK